MEPAKMKDVLIVTHDLLEKKKIILSTSKKTKCYIYQQTITSCSKIEDHKVAKGI